MSGEGSTAHECLARAFAKVAVISIDDLEDATPTAAAEITRQRAVWAVEEEMARWVTRPPHVDH